MSTTREVPGLDVVDFSGVLIGNTDIRTPEYVMTEITPGTTPLPIYPNQGDLPGSQS